MKTGRTAEEIKSQHGRFPDGLFAIAFELAILADEHFVSFSRIPDGLFAIAEAGNRIADSLDSCASTIKAIHNENLETLSKKIK